MKPVGEWNVLESNCFGYLIKMLKSFCDALVAHRPLPLCAASISRKRAEV
jgi:hypothetical protein